WQLHLRVDFAHGFFHGAAEIAAAHAVFERDVAVVPFARNLGCAIDHLDLAELRERDALAGGREQPDLLDGFLRIAIGLFVAGDKIVTALALQHLRDGIAADCGLDGVLHIGDVDSVAGGGATVHGEVEIGLADYAEHAEIGDSADAGEDSQNLVTQSLQLTQIRAVDLNGELAFDATDG